MFHLFRYSGIIGMIESSMAQHLWDEEFCLKAVWALLALAPAYGASTTVVVIAP
jgi:hypothetical protein